MKIPPSKRIPKNDGRPDEKTDPDYEEHKFSRLLSDFRSCPKKWRGEFLAGLPSAVKLALKKRFK